MQAADRRTLTVLADDGVLPRGAEGFGQAVETSPFRSKPLPYGCILLSFYPSILLPLRLMYELRKVEAQHVCRVLPKAMAASENLRLASS